MKKVQKIERTELKIQALIVEKQIDQRCGIVVSDMSSLYIGLPVFWLFEARMLESPRIPPPAVIEVYTVPVLGL